jgi:hypothetical protein
MSNFNITDDFYRRTRILKIILLIGIFLGFLVFLIAAYDEITMEVTSRDYNAKCYDKEGSAIQGLNCIGEIKCGNIGKRLNPERCYGGTK